MPITIDHPEKKNETARTAINQQLMDQDVRIISKDENQPLQLKRKTPLPETKVKYERPDYLLRLL